MANKLPKISVIIPVYNEERDIFLCLRSLQAQTYPNFEIIVVDDGSTDSTPTQVKRFPAIFLSQAHLGPGAARNLGANSAHGSSLVFVDADMTFDPNFLTRLTQPIRTGQALGTFSREEFLANSQNVWARCWNLNRGLPPHRMHPPHYPDHQPVFRAIRKSAFLRVGGFDAIGYDDDYTLSRKLQVLANSAPGAVFYHKNPDSLAQVWRQAHWMARRQYKLGPIGILFTLVRTSLPVSLLVGIFKSFLFSEPAFFLFKPIADTAVFLSLIKSSFNKFNYK